MDIKKRKSILEPHTWAALDLAGPWGSVDRNDPRFTRWMALTPRRLQVLVSASPFSAWKKGDLNGSDRIARTVQMILAGHPRKRIEDRM